MPSELATAERETLAVAEADIDAMLARCDGDARTAIRTLLAELEDARHEISWGYIRARPSRGHRDAAEG